MNDIINVLDKGFVRLVDSSKNGDQAVVDAARVSYGGSSKGAEADKKLLGYLLKHHHGTPFEATFFKFHIKAPILVFRQWHRHRIGVSYNELSARYTEMKDEFYIPAVWRAQDTKNKQGSVAAPLDHAMMNEVLTFGCTEAMARYRRLLSMGAAKEMARMVLPVNLYSEMYFTCNARSLMAFLSLRSDTHAQWEIRQYSHALAWFMKREMPWTYEALTNTAEPPVLPDLREMAESVANYEMAYSADGGGGCVPQMV